MQMQSWVKKKINWLKCLKILTPKFIICHLLLFPVTNMSPNASLRLLFVYLMFLWGTRNIGLWLQSRLFRWIKITDLVFYMWCLQIASFVTNWLFSRGAMLCVVKSKRKEKQAETLTQDYIITRKFSHICTRRHTRTHLSSKPFEE